MAPDLWIVADAITSRRTRPVIKGVVRLVETTLMDYAYTGHGLLVAASRNDRQPPSVPGRPPRRLQLAQRWLPRSVSPPFGLPFGMPGIGDERGQRGLGARP